MAHCFFFANYSNEFTCAIRGKLVPYYLRARARSISKKSFTAEIAEFAEKPNSWPRISTISTDQVKGKQKSV